MNQTTVASQTNGTPDHSLLSLLERIDARLSRLENVAARADAAANSAPALIATVVDSLDGLASRLASEGVDVDQRMRGMLRVIERLTAPRTAAAIEALLDSAMFDERPRDLPSLGFWGVMRALGDPDVQRTLGLLFTVAKEVGRSLATSKPLAQLPTHASGV